MDGLAADDGSEMGSVWECILHHAVHEWPNAVRTCIRAPIDGYMFRRAAAEHPDGDTSAGQDPDAGGTPIRGNAHEGAREDLRSRRREVEGDIGHGDTRRTNEASATASQICFLIWKCAHAG